jgi:hypothetical protein
VVMRNIGYDVTALEKSQNVELLKRNMSENTQDSSRWNVCTCDWSCADAVHELLTHLESVWGQPAFPHIVCMSDCLYQSSSVMPLYCMLERVNTFTSS